MERRLVQSSNVKSVGYDQRTGEMEVEFHTGRVYRYNQIPGIIHDGLLAARSPGGFLREWVQGRFDAKELIEGGKENA